MTSKAVLGRGLGSLIPQKQTITEQILPEAGRDVFEVSVDQIKRNPRQPRAHFSPSDLEDLINSIKEYGILQPLIVTKVDKGYELVAGERRLRSARALGLKTVPIIVRDANEQEKLEIALIENIQRQDLNAVEEALGFQALIDEFNLTQEEVARRIGKSRSVIANTLRLMDLPKEMLTALRSGKISKSHARTLLAQKDSKKQNVLFQSMLKGGVTVREAEARVSNVKRHVRKVGGSKDPNIAAHENRLREILGTKVLIQEKAGKGNISIEFYSKEELLDLLDRLSG